MKKPDENKVPIGLGLITAGVRASHQKSQRVLNITLRGSPYAAEL